MSEVFPFERPGLCYRLAMGIEYLGTAYRGWQVQKSKVPTIQQCVTAAISKVANHPVNVIVAGRTDAGVHATNQVIHFDTESYRDAYGWTMGVNAHLPDDIAIRWTQLVDESFHARFTAIERAYRFVIHNRWIKSAVLNPITTWERYPLDVDAMQQAATTLLGTHDFSSFRAAECQAHSPVKTLKELKLKRFGDLIVIQTRADGFLHHMVRNLVGVLLPIGRGRKSVEWAGEVLKAKNRQVAGVTADGSGLYFVRACYDHCWRLPQHTSGPDFIEPLLLNDSGFDDL